MMTMPLHICNLQLHVSTHVLIPLQLSQRLSMIFSCFLPHSLFSTNLSSHHMLQLLSNHLNTHSGCSWNRQYSSVKLHLWCPRGFILPVYQLSWFPTIYWNWFNVTCMNPLSNLQWHWFNASDDVYFIKSILCLTTSVLYLCETSSIWWYLTSFILWYLTSSILWYLTSSILWYLTSYIWWYLCTKTTTEILTYFIQTNVTR